VLNDVTLAELEDGPATDLPRLIETCLTGEPEWWLPFVLQSVRRRNDRAGSLAIAASDLTNGCSRAKLRAVESALTALVAEE
jgi:hypothetical protein